MKSAEGTEGFGAEAHSEANEREGKVGDALTTTNCVTAAVSAEDEDGVDDGVPGRPAPCVSEEMA